MEALCENTQVVVLMGGLGTRLGACTRDCPKPLMEVEGKPFFSYQLEIMRQAGFRRFLFCLGYRAEQIEEYYGDGSRFGVEIRYSRDGEKLLGTGGAIRKALPLLEETFLLIYGDSFMDVHYPEVLVRFREGLAAGKPALMTVMRNQGRFDRSNVLCRDGEILRYDKRNPSPEMDFIDYGIGAFSRSLFEEEPREAFDLSDLQQRLSREGKLACCETERRFYEIGTPGSLAEFRAYAARRWGQPRPAVFLDRDGVINEIVWNDDIDQLDSPLKWDQFRLMPEVPEALKLLQEKGYLLFVVTNQPAAAKGKTRYTTLCEINRRLVEEMRQAGVEITDVEMCPHYGKASARTRETWLIRDCSCRKPKPGLIERLTEKYRIDRERSWMVGDSATDVLCGQAAGVHTAFLGRYKCDLCMMCGCRKPERIAGNLMEFAKEVPNAAE